MSSDLDTLEDEWSKKDPREGWVAANRGPKGKHFWVQVEVAGRNCGAFYDIGSTRNFISRSCIDRLRLGHKVQTLSRPISSTMADKNTMTVHSFIKDVPCIFSYGDGEVKHNISFLVSNDLPFDMLMGMYYLSVAKPQFDWDDLVVKYELPDGKIVRLAKFKGPSSLVDSYGCLSATSFYNFYKQPEENGMFLVFVSIKGKPTGPPPEIERIVAKYPDLFEEPTGLEDREIVHAIEIIPGSFIPKGRIYRMSPAELDDLGSNSSD